MSQFVFKMPDLGEGTVEAEIVAWHTAPGAMVAEDQIIAEVMTDKAAVEVPAPVSGKVVSITGAPGDKVAVGAPLIVFETGTPAAAPAKAAGAGADKAGAAKIDDAAKAAAPPASAARAMPPAAAARAMPAPPPAASPGTVAPTGRIMTSPANRRRAREAGIDLASVVGSGPGGRIVREDLASAPAVPRGDVSAETSEIKVIGVRRLIAERMSEAKRNIPHFAYVEEVDVTELEALRQHLNSKSGPGEPCLDLFAPGDRRPGTHPGCPFRNAMCCTTRRAGCWCAIARCTWGSPRKRRKG